MASSSAADWAQQARRLCECRNVEWHCFALLLTCVLAASWTNTTIRLCSATTATLKGSCEQDTRRMLHAVYRVGNLDETIEYYKKHFGLKQLRYRDIPEVRTDNSPL